ncbi:MAG: S16 family serine protease, partial [Candidatus Hodarchaeales archaeon]
GWEIGKLTSNHYAQGYGLVMDYFAEILHALRNVDVLSQETKSFVLKNAGARDEKAVRKILSGLLKLLHPDGSVTEDELVEYLLLATELRQRIRDQLYLMAPGEFKGDTLVFSVNGRTYEPTLPDRQRETRIRIETSPVVGKVVGLAVTSEDIGMITSEDIGMIQLFEVLASKGRGGLYPLGNMGKVMKESVKTAYEYVHHNRRLFEIANEFKDGYDLSILALQMAVPKEGPSSGLAFVIGIISSLSKWPVRPLTAVTGEITLHGDVLPVGWIGSKIIAAKQAGAKRIIIPDGNRNEADQLLQELGNEIEFIFVRNVEEAIKVCLIRT